MGIERPKYSRSYVRTFGKKQAHRFVCNRCKIQFQPGETGKQTSFNAYKHIECPTGGDA
jgi:hypothetical protein